MSYVSKHPYFYVDTVTFSVEDCLFKLPRDPLEKESVAFRDMFLLPTGGNAQNEQEGQCDDNPIYLEGIKRNDFEDLLRVLLYRTHGASHQKSLPKTDRRWIAVLKLATLWGFDTVRQVAINKLRDDLSPVDRVVLAQVCNLDFEAWTLPAMNEIVRRGKPIDLEEGRRMGIDIALKLASIREQVSFGRREHKVVPGSRPNVEGLDFKPILRETFRTSSD